MLVWSSLNKSRYRASPAEVVFLALPRSTKTCCRGSVILEEVAVGTDARLPFVGTRPLQVGSVPVSLR